MDSPLLVPWKARPGCHEHLRQALEYAVNRQPQAWRHCPVSGEQFSTLAEAESRIIVWSLIEGFDIVRAGGGNKVSQAEIFRCIHHGQKTQNTRGLSERVQYDEEGNRISSRAREATGARQTDCPWCCRVSFKSVSRKAIDKDHKI